MKFELTAAVGMLVFVLIVMSAVVPTIQSSANSAVTYNNQPVYTPVVGENLSTFTSSWPDSNLSYGRLVLINNNLSVNVTDYAVEVNVTYDSDMNNDFSDVRFYYWNSTSYEYTYLPYWFEEGTWNNGSWVNAFVLVPFLENNTISGSVQMYYGNASYTYQGSGFEVFQFFDDFEAGSRNTSNWWMYGGSYGGCAQSDGRLWANGSDCYLESANGLYDDGRIYSSMYVTGVTGVSEYHWRLDGSIPITVISRSFSVNSNSDEDEIYINDGVTWHAEKLVSTSPASGTDFWRWRIDFLDNDHRVFRNWTDHLHVVNTTGPFPLTGIYMTYNVSEAGTPAYIGYYAIASIVAENFTPAVTIDSDEMNYTFMACETITLANTPVQNGSESFAYMLGGTPYSMLTEPENYTVTSYSDGQFLFCELRPPDPNNFWIIGNYSYQTTTLVPSNSSLNVIIGIIPLLIVVAVLAILAAFIMSSGVL